MKTTPRHYSRGVGHDRLKTNLESHFLSILVALPPTFPPTFFYEIYTRIPDMDPTGQIMVML
jgi:hypothetical protein